MALTGFIGRNGLAGWACLNPRVALAEHRLMREHRAREAVCQACGEDDPRRLEVHHITALWAWPEQAGTEPSGRFITLCDAAAHNCHLRHGHDGNFARRFVTNVVMVRRAVRMVQTEQRVVNREALGVGS